jgi:hypothetical protein
LSIARDLPRRLVIRRLAIAGRGLARDGDRGLVQRQPALELDGAGDFEHDRARPFGGRDPLPERTRAGIVQSCDLVNVTAAAARGEPTETFRAGESEVFFGGKHAGE